MNQLEMYTRLYVIKMILKDVSEEGISKVISQMHYDATNGKPLDVKHVQPMFSADIAPQMNQLIPELLKHGYAPNYLAEHFNISKATISYHRHNPSKKPYKNPYLQFSNTNYLPENNVYDN